jgi:hypothetical protein
VAYQRAFEAVVWAMPASSMKRFREGMLDVPGVEDNVILAYSEVLRPKLKAITANTATPYIAAVTDLRKGPVVVEVPAVSDKDGNPMEANKLYRIRVPKDTPAKQFWSITVYDNANWGFIDNPMDRSGLGTFDKDKMKVNDDGSVDIYVGPKAPKGLESNWIPTMGKKPYITMLFGHKGKQEEHH